MADPERRIKIAASQRRAWAKRLADPVERAAAAASGKILAERYRPTAEIIARQSRGRTAAIVAGRNPRCWAPPPGYEALNAELRRKGMLQADRKRIIAEQVAADERARIAAMTPLERQLDKLNRGGRLIERIPMPSRVYQETLGGVSGGLL